MGFLLKKLVSRLFFPVPLTLLTLMAGVACLWCRKRRRQAKVLVTVGTLLLLFFSSGSVGKLLLRPLERRHPCCLVDPSTGSEPPLEAGTWICVLGSGFRPDARLPFPSHVGSGSAARLLEGTRLYKASSGVHLAVAIPTSVDRAVKLSFLRNWESLVGLPDGTCHLLDGARDTRGEARLVRELAEGSPVVVVTSASHMPRAIVIFRKLGIEAIPAPCDPMAAPSPGFRLHHLYPNAGGLEMTERAVYEYLGLCWEAIRR